MESLCLRKKCHFDDILISFDDKYQTKYDDDNK